MGRNEQILKLSKSMQKSLDKLKLLDCSMDSTYYGICIFDNTIEPIKGLPSEGDDYDNCVAFRFDTDRPKSNQSSK